ncbi:MAG: hypothetical protein LBI04_05875 [Treponema sp.]|jgi:hypothetical protein|nr:hypothetical protein [Treponema sp.]
MKNYKIYCGIFSILMGLLLLAGCSNDVDSPDQGNPGGRVTISINPDMSRTLLPGAPLFDKYVLTFTANAGQTPVSPVELENTNEYSLVLEPGYWAIDVIGMVKIEDIPGIEDGYYEAASSEQVYFNVGAGGSYNVAVTVRGGIQEGVQGIFSWDISFPNDVEAGTLKIQDIDEQDIDGIPAVDLMTEEDRTGVIALNPGYYFLKVELENGDGNKAFRTEIMHIYSSLTTTADSTTGYAFTGANFAPLVTLNGQVLLSTDAGLDPQGTVSIYRDSAFTQLIDSISFDENGDWSYQISTLYTNVYLKASVSYTGFTAFEKDKGPVNITSNAPDCNINAQLLNLSGTVLLDTVTTTGTPTVTLYEDAWYNDLIATTNIAVNGSWSVTLIPVYTNVYLRANVNYTGGLAFTKDIGPVSVTSADPDDWTIDAALLHLAGTVVLDDDVAASATTPPTLTLYSNAAYTASIATANVDPDNGSWSVVLLPDYTVVYLEAEVEYTGFDSFTKRKGPVNVTSTTITDWTIDAALLHLAGTVQLDDIVATEVTAPPAITLYKDALYSDDIAMANVAADGSWSVTLIPDYTNVYMKAAVEYTGFAPFTKNKGPVNVTSTTAADWIIDAKLLHLAGTVDLDTVEAITAANPPTLTLYSNAAYTDFIATVLVDPADGSWSKVLLPNYTSVYLRAAVEYDGFDPFTKDKGPVNVTSTNTADWTIDAKMISVAGNVEFRDIGTLTLNSRNMLVYNDADYTTLIATIPIDTNGDWVERIPPLFNSRMYLRGELIYDTNTLTKDQTVNLPPPASITMDMRYFLLAATGITGGSVTVVQGQVQGFVAQAGDAVKLKVSRPDTLRLVPGSLKYNTTAMNDYSPWTFTMPAEDVTVTADFEGIAGAVAYMDGIYYTSIGNAIDAVPASPYSNVKTIWIYSDITLTSGTSIPQHKDICLQALDWEERTIKRGSSYTGNLFTINAPNTPSTSYNYTSLTIGAANSEGTLIIDGQGSQGVNSTGPLVQVSCGVFNLRKGGILQNNRNSGNGGAINVNYNTYGYCVIAGGEIKNNTAASGGGVYVSGPVQTSAMNVNFWLQGGSISGNTTSGYGGGVYVYGVGCNQNGGLISGNTANRGGGIYLSSTFSTAAGWNIYTGGQLAIDTTNSGYGSVAYITANSMLNNSFLSNDRVIDTSLP